MAPMRSPRREVYAGVFVVIGILATIGVLFAITDPGTFRGRYLVSTVVQDAEGIRKGDPVRMKGVNVGRITDFRFEGRGVRVTFELLSEYPVPADSRVSIVSGGLLQSMVAEVQPGTSRERMRAGTELPYVSEAGMVESFEILGARGDTVLLRAQELLSERTIGAVGASAQEMQALLAELTAMAGEQRRQLAVLTSSLQRSAQGLEGAATRPELARAITRTDSLTLRLDAATTSLQAASASLATLVGRIERGEGTLGRLAQDELLYQNLNAAVTSLNQLTTDIRENQRRYINVSVF